MQIEDEIHGLAYHTRRHERGGLRRRRDGSAGARAQGRRRHHRRHAGPADGSHAAAERRLQRHRAARPRRSRPHDGHGLLARRPAHHRRDAAASARRCSSRRRCRTKSCGWRWRSCASQVRAGRPRSGPAKIDHPPVQTCRADEKLDWLTQFLRRRAKGRCWCSCAPRSAPIGWRATSRGRASSARRCTRDRTQDQRHGGGRRIPERPVYGAGRHRHRGARPRHRRHPHVINYEVPDSPDAYVHRVGRTGRDRATGTAVTLVAPEELRALRALEKSVGLPSITTIWTVPQERPRQ